MPWPPLEGDVLEVYGYFIRAHNRGKLSGQSPPVGKPDLSGEPEFVSRGREFESTLGVSC